jgi:hypothetical protein
MPAVDRCPFCEDYDEARALNALDELLDERPATVVPHVRA